MTRLWGLVRYDQITTRYQTSMLLATWMMSSPPSHRYDQVGHRWKKKESSSLLSISSSRSLADAMYYTLFSFEFNLRIEGIYMVFHVYQVHFKKLSIAPSGCSFVIVVEPGKLLPPAIYLVGCLKLQDSFQNQSNWQTFFNCDLYSSSILLALYPSLQSKKLQNQSHSVSTC